MSDLKKCPFCGNEPTIRIFKGKDGWRDRYAVLCRYDDGGCGAESGLYHYEEEAIEAWNRRIPYIPEIEGFDPEHLTDRDKKDITDALNFLMDKIKEEP